jgi:hypothetical protein
VAITELASLSQVREYLRIPAANTGDNDILTTVFMPAAQAVIERELGRIVAYKVNAERHDGGRGEIWLREIPVLYIENCEEGWGYYDWELDDQEVNSIPALSMWAYSLDIPDEGLLTRRSQGNVNIPFMAGRNNIRVDYVAGRVDMPTNAVLAFLELLAHWYRVSQLRSSNQSAGGGFQPSAVINNDFTRATGITSINMGVPMEILELLKPDRRRPIVG